MIVYKLKNLLQNKNVIFFIICYRIHSKFITETASETSFTKYVLQLQSRSQKSNFEEVILQLSCLLEVSSFAKMKPHIYKFFDHRCRTACIFFPSEHLQNKSCLIEYFPMAALYTLKWNQTFGNGHEKVDFKAVDQMFWHYFYIKTCHNG